MIANLKVVLSDTLVNNAQVPSTADLLEPVVGHIMTDSRSRRKKASPSEPTDRAPSTRSCHNYSLMSANSWKVSSIDMMIQLSAQRSGLGLEKSVVCAFMRRTFQIVTFLDASKTRSKILSQVARRGRY